MSTFRNFIEKVGKTPLVRFGEYGNATLFLKLEGENPTGSLKDRSALYILKGMEDSGLLQGKTILDASSGSFGCAISYIGALMGYPVKVITNAKCTSENFGFMQLMGARVEKHGKLTGESNAYCQSLLKQHPDQYAFCDQLNNWDSVRAHQCSTAPEIFAELPDVTAIAASMGSGATLCGLGNFLAEQQRQQSVKLIASVAQPGTTIAGTFKAGRDYVTPFIQKLWREKFLYAQVPISRDQAYERAREFAKYGFLVGPQTGGVIQATMSAIDEHDLRGNIVIISGDNAWKNNASLVASSYTEQSQ